MDGNYDGSLWIMNVDNKYSNEAYASNVDKLKEKSSKYDTNDLPSNVVAKDNIATTDTYTKIIQNRRSTFWILYYCKCIR